MNPFKQIKIRYVFLVILGYIVLNIFLGDYFDVENNILGALLTQIGYQLIIFFWMFYEMIKVNKTADFKIRHFFEKDYTEKDLTTVYLFLLFIALFFSNIISTSIIQLMPEFIQNYFERIMNEYQDAVVFSQNGSFLISTLQFLSIVILAPIVEEFFYRGFLINRLSLKFNLRWAVLISTVLFTLGHGDIIGSFIKGYAFSILYIKTKSLKLPIIFHVLNNLIAFTLFKTFDSVDVENLYIPNSVAVIMSLLIVISFPLLIHFFYMYRVKDEKVSPFEKIFNGVDENVQDE
ncbi:MAG: CPBP family intramembrane glutamic endopeptidase [Thermotogota bacterium]